MRYGPVSVVVVLAVLGSAPATAHQSATGQDYSKFRQPNGASCCDDRDCRPVDYQLRPDGDVVMFPEGQTIVVPRDKLNEQSSDDGRAHWCGIVFPGGNTQTFCAILPRQMTRWLDPGAAVRKAVLAPAEQAIRLVVAGWTGPSRPMGPICRGAR